MRPLLRRVQIFSHAMVISRYQSLAFPCPPTPLLLDPHLCTQLLKRVAGISGGGGCASEVLSLSFWIFCDHNQQEAEHRSVIMFPNFWHTGEDTYFKLMLILEVCRT